MFPPHRSRGFSWSRLLLALAALALGVWLVCLAAVIVWANRDGARPAQAIVVLGAAQYQGNPSPVLRARLDHALDLWRRGLAERVVLTGGSSEGDTWSEASVGRRYVMRRGVPDSVILLEPHGRSSTESLAAVAELMAERPGRDVILVSDGFHMLRLAILAQRFGLVPYTSPTRTSPIAANRNVQWKYYLGESVKAPMALFQR